MKITKNYPNLTQVNTGEYILDGDLITMQNIKIDLDDCLIVTGDIQTERGIQAKYGITAWGDITAGWGIEAGWIVKARGSITTGREIKAGWGIEAGDSIEVGTFIDCGKRIFAGVSVYDDREDCNDTIKCAELRNGTVAFGELIITGKES